MVSLRGHRGSTRRSTTVTVRRLLIKKISGEDIHFQIDGTESWTQPGPPGMVAHDVFHHAPDDSGTLAEELMSFGTQAWLNHHVDDLRLGIGHEELCAVLVANAETGSALGIDGLPPAHETVDLRFIKRFLRVARKAYEETSFDEALAHIDDATMGSLCDRPHLHRCSAWMSWGMREAESRFPDPQATWRRFNDFQRALSQWAKSSDSPDQVLFVLDERQSKLWSDDPWMAEILSRRQNGPLKRWMRAP